MIAITQEGEEAEAVVEVGGVQTIGEGISK